MGFIKQPMTHRVAGLSKIGDQVTALATERVSSSVRTTQGWIMPEQGTPK